MSERLYLEDLLSELQKAQKVSSKFQDILVGSEALSWDAPSGFVWQESWVGFWKRIDATEQHILRLGEIVENMFPTLGTLIESYTDPPLEARVTTAIGDPQFIHRDFLEGKEDVAYSIQRLMSWHDAYSWWLDFSIKNVTQILNSH